VASAHDASGYAMSGMLFLAASITTQATTLLGRPATPILLWQHYHLYHALLPWPSQSYGKPPFQLPSGNNSSFRTNPTVMITNPDLELARTSVIQHAAAIDCFDVQE
jgi:hypothetical protein